MSEYLRLDNYDWPEYGDAHHIHTGTEIEGGVWSIEELDEIQGVKFPSKTFQQVKVSGLNDELYDSFSDYAGKYETMMTPDDTEWAWTTLDRLKNEINYYTENLVDEGPEIFAEFTTDETRHWADPLAEQIGLDPETTTFTAPELMAAPVLVEIMEEYIRGEYDTLEELRQYDEVLPIQEFFGTNSDRAETNIMGDCCIRSLAAAWVLEQKYREGEFRATGVINQNFHREKKGHVWAEMVTPEGERIVLDPGLKYVGVPDDNVHFSERHINEAMMMNGPGELDSWNYNPDLDLKPEIFENSGTA